MTNQHPITPPPELVRQWQREANHNEPMFAQVAIFAAQWGADQELKACCEYLKDTELCDQFFYKALRKHRRPKPPSLKELAFDDLVAAYNANKIDDTTYENINRALERLQELEGGND